MNGVGTYKEMTGATRHENCVWKDGKLDSCEKIDVELSNIEDLGENTRTQWMQTCHTFLAFLKSLEKDFENHNSALIDVLQQASKTFLQEAELEEASFREADRVLRKFDEAWDGSDMLRSGKYCGLQRRLTKELNRGLEKAAADAAAIRDFWSTPTWKTSPDYRKDIVKVTKEELTRVAGERWPLLEE